MCIYACAEFLEGKQIMARKARCVAEVTLCISSRNNINYLAVYATACMQHQYGNGESGKPPTENAPTLKLISNNLWNCYFKKHLANMGTIFLNILQTWDIFLHTEFTELQIFFMTRSTTFFSSTVFVISMFAVLCRRFTLKKLFLLNP